MRLKQNQFGEVPRFVERNVHIILSVTRSLGLLPFRSLLATDKCTLLAHIQRLVAPTSAYVVRQLDEARLESVNKITASVHNQPVTMNGLKNCSNVRLNVS